MEFGGTEIAQFEEIKRIMVGYYENLYTDTESWRPCFDYPSCPKVNEEECEWLQVLYYYLEIIKLLMTG